MATMNVTPNVNGFRLVHPLDDIGEQKCSSEGLGKNQDNASSSCFAWSIASYLILMTLMLGYHVLDPSGLLHKVR